MNRESLTDAQRKWLADVVQAAQDARTQAMANWKRPILASTCIAQAILETDWGAERLPREANNFFGIKAGGAWKGDVAVIRAQEWINGKKQLTAAAYRKYPTIEACFLDYARLVSTSGYYRRAVDVLAKSLTAGSMETWEYYTRSLGEVWSADPHYGAGAVELIRSLDLLTYDQPLA